jgi:hypothetical protein
MRGADAGSRPWKTLVSCSLAVWLLGSAPVQAAAPALEDKIPDLKAARQGARGRLGRPECLAVLTDFESVNGRRLDEVLRASGRTAQQQLDLLVLQSGRGRRDCDRAAVLASTSVRSLVISVCVPRFMFLGPAHQEAILIHEMLHSLGLGENPPDSLTITKRVMDRCGR